MWYGTEAKRHFWAYRNAQYADASLPTCSCWDLHLCFRKFQLPLRASRDFVVRVESFLKRILFFKAFLAIKARYMLAPATIIRLLQIQWNSTCFLKDDAITTSPFSRKLPYTQGDRHSAHCIFSDALLMRRAATLQGTKGQLHTVVPLPWFLPFIQRTNPSSWRPTALSASTRALSSSRQLE